MYTHSFPWVRHPFLNVVVKFSRCWLGRCQKIAVLYCASASNFWASHVCHIFSSGWVSASIYSCNEVCCLSCMQPLLQFCLLAVRWLELLMESLRMGIWLRWTWVLIGWKVSCITFLNTFLKILFLQPNLPTGTVRDPGWHYVIHLDPNQTGVVTISSLLSIMAD